MGKIRRLIWVLWLTWPVLLVRSEISPGDVGAGGNNTSNIGGHGNNDAGARPRWKGSKGEDPLDVCTNSRPWGSDSSSSSSSSAPAAPSAGGGW